MDDARLAEIFAREVLMFLVGKELISPEWGERILTWRHTGFNVHSFKFLNHLKLTFVAERPPPPQVASQELLMAADPPAEYFS